MVFLGTFEPNPFLDHVFVIRNDLLFCIAKCKYRPGSVSHIRSETSRHRPPTALKLGSEDTQLSGAYVLQVRWGPVSWGVSTHGSGEASRTKITLISLLLNGTREARASCGFLTPNGKTGFVFCFPIHLSNHAHRAWMSPNGDSLTCILYMQVTDTWSLLGECVRL